MPISPLAARRPPFGLAGLFISNEGIKNEHRRCCLGFVRWCWCYWVCCIGDHRLEGCQAGHTDWHVTKMAWHRSTRNPQMVPRYRVRCGAGPARGAYLDGVAVIDGGVVLSGVGCSL